jgi:hypothetical protein
MAGKLTWHAGPVFLNRSDEVNAALLRFKFDLKLVSTACFHQKLINY